MVEVPSRPRSPWLRIFWFALAIALFLASYSLGNRLVKPRSPGTGPSLALLIYPPIPLGDFRLSDGAGGEVTREALSGHWSLMVLAPGEDSLRPWLQRLAAIFNQLAPEPKLQARLLLAPTLTAAGPAQSPGPTTPPWRLLRGSEAEIAGLRGQLGLAPAPAPAPAAGVARPETEELLLVIDPQARLYGSYRLEQPPEAIARDLVALVERYDIETEGAQPRGH